MGSVVHVAGLTILLPGRVIQRCAVCGEMLCDSKDAMMPVGEDGEAPEFPTWETGRLVRVTVGNPTGYTLLPDADQLPEDSCEGLIDRPVCNNRCRPLTLPDRSPWDAIMGTDLQGECPGHERGGTGQPCCDRAGEYNGYNSDGPLLFRCPKGCGCHD